jgi:chromosome segregation ATPase
MPYLAFNLNDGNEFVFDILEERLSIGRDAKNDIVIDNSYISGFHAEMTKQVDGSYELIDLKSSNGTFVNGQRIERSRIKGGDKIRFGQLDSRFRERAPKGTAPSTELKLGSGVKRLEPKTDGRSGNTDSIPARDAPANETGPILPTRQPVVRTETGKSPMAPSAVSLPIQRGEAIDPTHKKQSDELQEELAKLRIERDLLRTENEKESRRRDEVRAIEKELEARQIEATLAEDNLAKLKADLAHVQTELETLTIKRRESANLDSQLESNRTELSKVQTDINIATSGLQALHRDAEKAQKNRQESAAQVEELKSQLQKSEAHAQELTAELKNFTERSQKLDQLHADAANSEATLKTLEALISSKKDELSKIETSLKVAQQSVQTTQSEAHNGVAELTTQKQQLEQQVSALRAQLSDSELEAKSRSLDEEIKTKSRTLQSLERELVQLQTKSADLTHKLDDLAGADIKLSNANETLKVVESHKAELTAAIQQMSAQRDTLTRELLEATEQGRAQHTLTQTLSVRRKVLEKEILSTEEQKATLSAELGKVRESLRSTEISFEVKQKQLSEAEAKAEQALEQTKEASRHHDHLQTEMRQLREKISSSQTELAAIHAEAESKRIAAESAAASHEQHNTRLLDLQSKIGGLESLLTTLTATHLVSQNELTSLTSQHREATELLKTRQQEIAASEARLTELRGLTTSFDTRVIELTKTENKLGETKAALIIATQEFKKAKAEAQRLNDERIDHEKRLPSLREETSKLQFDLAENLKSIATTEVRITGLTQQAKDLGTKLVELNNAEANLEKAKLEINKLGIEKETINGFVASLLTEREEHEAILPGLKADVEVLRTEVRILGQDKQNTAAALEKAQVDRRAASEQAEALRLEAVNLDKLLNDKRNNLETETKNKLAEANNAEAKLREVTAKVTAAENRALELATVEKQLATAIQACKDSEKLRQTEEKVAAELISQQAKSRKDLAVIQQTIKETNLQIAELTKKLQFEDARQAEVLSRTEQANQALQSAQTKLQEAQVAVLKIREEETNLRKGIPALNTEMAGIQAMLVALSRERDEASQYVTRLNVTTDSSNKKLAELQQQISQLEEAHRLREERLIKAQTEVDAENTRLKAAQDQLRAHESLLQEIEREVKEARPKAEAARTQVSNLEGELTQRLDRVQTLKQEEDRLGKELASRQEALEKADAILAETRDQISIEQQRVIEFTHVGNQILTLGAALASLTTRQSETNNALREAAERELFLQVKINSLQESYNRDSARAEAAKKERVETESALAEIIDKSQKQSASLTALESEQRKRLTEIEKTLHDHVTQTESVKLELSSLQQRRAEFAQAEVQLRHWQEIESRLRGQLVELEEKHEIMRRGLPADEGTVIMFANDLIKRIDLIDALSARYSGHNGGDISAQLGTLRASFEDILLQHGVHEFDIAVGTEVDTQLRKRIAVVDSLPGKEKPRVIETCRSGFIYSREEGQEVILRKVEVRTSSQ